MQQASWDCTSSWALLCSNPESISQMLTVGCFQSSPHQAFTEDHGISPRGALSSPHPGIVLSEGHGKPSHPRILHGSPGWYLIGPAQEAPGCPPWGLCPCWSGFSPDLSPLSGFGGIAVLKIISLERLGNPRIGWEEPRKKPIWCLILRQGVNIDGWRTGLWKWQQRRNQAGSSLRACARRAQKKWSRLQRVGWEQSVCRWKSALSLGSGVSTVWWLKAWSLTSKSLDLNPLTTGHVTLNELLNYPPSQSSSL